MQKIVPIVCIVVLNLTVVALMTLIILKSK